MFVPTRKGDECLGIPKGTKLTDKPKDTTLKVRMDAETKLKLDKLAQIKKISRSEIVRMGIDQQYAELTK